MGSVHGALCFVYWAEHVPFLNLTNITKATWTDPQNDLLIRGGSLLVAGGIFVRPCPTHSYPTLSAVTLNHFIFADQCSQQGIRFLYSHNTQSKPGVFAYMYITILTIDRLRATVCAIVKQIRYWDSPSGQFQHLSPTHIPPSSSKIKKPGTCPLKAMNHDIVINKTHSMYWFLTC